MTTNPLTRFGLLAGLDTRLAEHTAGRSARQ